MVRARRALLCCLAAGLAVAGCGPAHRDAAPGTGVSVPGPTTPTTAQAVPVGAHLVWSACRSGQGPAGYQCATLQVPLDYADPAKGTIGLALDRHPATGTRIGSLLVNPGGPGVSGVDYLPDAVGELSGSVTEHFDVVGFDPRGVDRSDPVTCGDGAALDAEIGADPSPPTAAGFATLVALDRRFVAGCEARSGALLPYVGTVDAARDLDRIRAALGDARLTYLGFSYGTYLGAVYASLFPTRIRAMVLDGALDPDISPVTLDETQAAALDAEFRAFLADCAGAGCGWRPAGNLAGDFDALVTRVRADPVAVAGTTQRVGPAALLYAAAFGLYSEASWPILGQALAALEAGNGAPVLSLFDQYVGRSASGQYANTVEAETAVDCMDAPAPTVAAIRAAAPAAEAAAPVFGLLDLYSEVTCSLWPVPATGRVAPIRAAGSPPIVVVGSTGDPVTPYAWAKALAGQLAHGVLLTRVGYGHTGYAYSACVRAAVNTYLVGLTPPPAGTTCSS